MTTPSPPIPPTRLAAAWAWLRARTTFALVVLTVGFGFSLAGNVAWTWESGPVRIAGGALASLALPAAVHLWPAVPTHGRWLTPDWRLLGAAGNQAVELRRAVRAVVMTAIAVLAAATTFYHASELLIANGEAPLLAWAYPLITEAVVVMAVLAHRAAGDDADVEVGGGSHELPEVPGVDPAVVRRARALLDRDPKLGWRRLVAELDVSEHYAKRLLAALRPLAVAS